MLYCQQSIFYDRCQSLVQRCMRRPGKLGIPFAGGEQYICTVLHYFLFNNDSSV